MKEKVVFKGRDFSVLRKSWREGEKVGRRDDREGFRGEEFSDFWWFFGVNMIYNLKMVLGIGLVV